jgi:hypothetical protein
VIGVENTPGFEVSDRALDGRTQPIHLFRPGPDTSRPIPVAFPGRRRHRCADRMGHVVSIRASPLRRPGVSASAKADEGPVGGQGYRVRPDERRASRRAVRERSRSRAGCAGYRAGSSSACGGARISMVGK